jgi:hypothetical protein
VPSVSRRQFLRVGTLGTTLGLGGLARLGELAGLASAVPTPDAATSGPIAGLGRAYLALHPNEASPAKLLRLVPEIDPKRPMIEQFGEVAKTVSADFADDRVVSVDGWQLAATEARLAALVALGR